MKEKNKQLGDIIWNNKQILNAIDNLALTMNNYYHENDDVIVMAILDGVIVFLGNLLTKLKFHPTLATLKLSLYGMETTARLNHIHNAYDFSYVNGKKLLILEDLLDTGSTLAQLLDILKDYTPIDIKICTLFKKKNVSEFKKTMKVNVDWVGLEVPNEWIVGFGIDFKGKYRSLPDLRFVKKEEI